MTTLAPRCGCSAGEQSPLVKENYFRIRASAAPPVPLPYGHDVSAKNF